MSFTWVEWKGLTPLQLGLAPQDLDPVWHDAILAVRGGYSAEKTKQWNS